MAFKVTLQSLGGFMLYGPEPSANRLFIMPSTAGSHGVAGPLTSSECVPSGGEKLRFVGKHSKDLSMSLYLQKRNIHESELDSLGEDDSGNYEGGGLYCEPLSCILRVKPDMAAKLKSNGQCIVVGVLARLACDVGMQFNEYILYQVETKLQPHGMGGAVGGGLFDFDSTFVGTLPDEWHYPFTVQLPGGLPPSVYMKNATISSGHWGLTWYVFAYVASEQAAQSTLDKHGVDGVWPRLKLGRRHSKVFLSFSKTSVCSYERIMRNIPPSLGMNKRRSFLSSGQPLILEASLDKPIYFAGEKIRVSLKILNHGKQKVAGIRVTLKQLITIKYGGEPRQEIKSTVAEYEGPGGEAYGDVREFSTDDILIEASPLPTKPNYQLALECILPRSLEQPQRLCPSVLFTGLSWRGASFGVDKLRIFSVVYYINVHAVIPWSSNLIVKLPFQVAASLEERPLSTLQQPSTSLPSRSLTYSHTPSSSTKAMGSRKTKTGSTFGDNLLAFDSDEEDNDAILGLEDGEEPPILPLYPRHQSLPLPRPDHQPLSPSAGSPGSIFSPSLQPTHPQTFSRLDNVESGVSWKDDLRLAQDLMNKHRNALIKLHHGVTEEPLDRRSLAMRHSIQRVAMNWTLLEILNSILLHDIPRFKTAIQMNKKGDYSVKRFNLAQCLAQRLMSLAKAHADLLPITWPKGDLLDSRMEAISQIFDDYELVLIRALKDAHEDCEIILDKMSKMSWSLLQDLPAFSTCQAALLRLRRCLVQGGWCTISSRAFINATDLSEEVIEECEDEDLESILGNMATLFQAIYETLDDLTCNSEDFAKLFSGYTQRLSAILDSDLSKKSLAPVAFFNWRFLVLAVEKHYLGRLGSSISRVLLADVNPPSSLHWSQTVESSTPARFLISSSTTNNNNNSSSSGELEDCAHQVIQFTQKLV